MKKTLPLVLGLVMLAGCGPTQQAGEETRVARTPVDLRVTPDHRRLIVDWHTQGSASFSGFNIYIVPSDASLDNPKPFNQTPFPGDTTPDDGRDTFEAEGLENGVTYRVWVRAKYGDGSESKSTDTETAVCGGRGLMTLGVRYNSDNDGFSFAENQPVRANAAANDLYFLSLKGVAYLASPTRLDGFLRASSFLVLPWKGDFAAVSAHVMKNRPQATEERVLVQPGDWVLVKTADGAHTLLNVLESSGDSDETAALHLWYAYCPLVDRLFF